MHTTLTRKPPGAMKLKKVDENTYQVHTQRGAWEGSLTKIWQKMHWEFEIQNSEIRLALSEMNKNDHNTAHFGILGTFIFTSNS